MTTLISQLESGCLPHLRATQARLQAAFPKLTINIWSSPTGSLTPWQGHDLGIEAELSALENRDEPNWLVPDVSTHQLTCEPKLQAFVSWGYSQSLSLGQTFEDPQLLTEENVDLLVQSLPVLLNSFEAALRDRNSE